ncbi:PAS domain S-box protein [Lysobacter korlensis]|uniref:histidine kinase n=1 Tax=Lysobacter korlensis TaxID=553636 RepID=A0ABV6RT29_9GAMM
MSDPNPLYSLLPKQSETVGLLMRLGGEKTGLGPIETWPEPLRNALGIMLNCRFPMFIWWGDRMINFYNDAYIPILGKRHPEAFGGEAAVIWHEIWGTLQDDIRAVMERGQSSWHERVMLPVERHGFPEEAWFTWSYSAIPDGSGGIGGLLCVVAEETRHVAAERERDRLLAQIDYERRQLAEAFERSPACMAVLRGPDYVFEFANPRYLELVGDREIIGRPVREAMPELVEQGFLTLIDEVYQTGKPYVGRDVAVRLQRDRSGPMETRYLDFMYQPLLTPDGRVDGLIGHGVDITERRRAEARDRFLVELDEAVRPLVRAEDITQTCARLLGEYLDADRCAYADVEADEDTFNLTGDYTRGVQSIVGRYTFTAFGEDVLRLMRSGEVYRVTDVESYTPPIGDLTAYRLTQIRAVVCVPVLKSGRFVAAMAVHQATPRNWADDEVDLVLHVANRCWESIERARVERELRRSEQRFRAAVDATSSIFWNCTATGEFHNEQPSWAAFTGQTFDEYRGYGWTASVHPDDVPGTLERWNAAVTAQSMFATQHRLRRHDGTYRFCDVRAVPVPDESGQALEWVGTHTDISERVEFEQSLQESEARFRMLSDSAPVMIWMTRPDGRVEYVSRQWIEFTGQEQAHALGSGWVDAVHPDDLERATRYYTEKNARQEAFSIEYALRRRDGAYRWCVDTGTPRHSANGEFLGYIGTVSDITERKRAEETLASEKRVLELIATGSPLHEVLDTLVRRIESQSGDGMLASVLLVSEDGSCLRPGAGPSLPPAVYAAFDGLPIAAGIAPCSTAAHEGTTVIAADLLADPQWAAVHALASAAGIAACTSNPIVGSDGRVLGSLGLYYRQPREPGERDRELARLGTHLAGIVIEKHELDQRLQRSLESEQQARSLAERANGMKDEFLATLSHELRTPLNAILGWVAILRLQRSLPDELLQAVDVIERNARAQSQIIADLLDMSSIVSGKIALELERQPVHELVASAIQTVMPTVQAKDLQIDVTIDADAKVPVDIDPSRMQQVMWNLLNNAAKFTPRGGRIDVRLHRRATALEIVVSDSGEGIAPEFLPYVFDRFRQADSSISRRHGGLGLGLSIVRRLVDLHGGQVQVHSDGPGQGATFSVLLPLPSPSRDRRAPDAGEPVRARQAGQLSGLRILVVDDDADARLMTARLLESAGAQVSLSESAGDALGMLAGQAFDLLVSDIGMPGQDGYELVRHLRADAASPNHTIPAIALTAYARTQERLRALQAGFQQHLAKPVEPVVLVETVAALAQTLRQPVTAG